MANGKQKSMDGLTYIKQSRLNKKLSQKTKKDLISDQLARMI